jgi:phage-related protein
MRTSVEEIDGRDGDIVTTLGYSAYDKEMTIGLYGEYDIDDVIDFFNVSGTITFSNEPDKYYNFALYEAIDFERLIRFRTAKVKIHVQPFKYSESETDIVNIYPDNTTMASISVRNSGNVYSKPTITIKGKGNISVALGNTQLFSIVLPSASLNTIIIDSSEMNAYNEDNVFMNRAVTGDYSNFIFKVGLNNLTINGDISEVIISKYSRWI